MTTPSPDFPFLVEKAPSMLPGNPVATHVFFAARIASVPDLSSYQEFERVDLLDQLQRVIEAQRILLLGLAQQPLHNDVYRALDLRYIFRPGSGQGQLTLALLGKACAEQHDKALQAARALWEDTAKLFPHHLYRSGLELITDTAAIKCIREPIAQGQRVVTIGKQVGRTNLLRLNGAHPVPYPLRWGISTMRDMCKTMLRFGQPCFLSVALTPTRLQHEERQALNVIAGRLRKLGEGRDRSRRVGLSSSLASGQQSVTMQNMVGQQDRESFLPDPQAQINGEIYERYLRGLDNPLLWRCYVVGEGTVPSSVVGAFYAEIVGSRPPSVRGDDKSETIHLPADRLLTGTERAHALDALRMIEFPDHDQRKAMLVEQGELRDAYHSLARLPQLVDVQEASCVFRMPCLPHRDEIGIPTHSGAFVTLAQPDQPAATLTIGHHNDRTPHRVALSDLTRHTLVAGTTGSGKTTSCLNMLEALLRASPPIPFLVIEPVNAVHNDYRALLELANIPRVHVFTLGDEQVAPFRLNPFEIASEITVSEHISSLLSCFKAAIPMWEPLPRVFLKALNRTYYRAGWNAARKAGGPNDPPFPTLYEFYVELCMVVDREIDHGGEVQSNIRGASKLRIEALLEGSCGRTLMTPVSLQADLWLKQPTILELRHIGDDEDKALMTAFVLLALREHCETRPRQAGLQHVTLIEEAHRLLGKAPEGASADVATIRGQAAAAFAGMLAETRKYGEGLIIAEQLPTKLVPDVIGNTGLKILHRLTAKDDREVLGRAMRLNSFQEDAVAALEPGQAVVYAQGSVEPVMVHIEGRVWDERRRNAPVDLKIRERMNHVVPQLNLLPFAGCALCPVRCKYRDDGEALAQDRSFGYEALIEQALTHIDPDQPGSAMATLTAVSQQAVAQHLTHVNAVDHPAVAYCAFLHLTARSLIFHGMEIHNWHRRFQEIQQR